MDENTAMMIIFVSLFVVVGVCVLVTILLGHKETMKAMELGYEQELAPTQYQSRWVKKK